MPATKDLVPTPTDRAALGVTMILGAIAAGWILTWLFETMRANGGVAALGSPGENSPLPLELVPAFAVASLGAPAVAFQIGHRLQRETEGLV